MEEKNKYDLEDRKLRDILSGTKIEASNNLRFRVMQQIETEKILIGKKSQSSFSVLKNMLSIFGTMYAVIGVIAVGLYFNYGQESLETPYLYWVAILVTFICVMFWVLSVFDEKRRTEKRKKPDR